MQTWEYKYPTKTLTWILGGSGITTLHGDSNFLQSLHTLVTAPFYINAFSTQNPISVSALTLWLAHNHLVDMRWYFIAVLFGIAPISGVDNLLMCLLCNWIPSKKCLLGDTVRFWRGYFPFISMVTVLNSALAGFSVSGAHQLQICNV